MKKTTTIGALMTLLMTGNSTAVTLYDNDYDFELSLKGDLQVQLFQEPGSNQDLKVDYDDLELKFGAKYFLGSDMSAFGQLDIDWKNQGDGSDDDVVDDAYVGIDFGAVSVAIGRMVWGSDSMFSEQAFEMDGGIAFVDTSGEDTVQLAYSANDFDAILSTDLEEEGDESAVDFYIATKISTVHIALAYQSYTESANAESVNTIGVLANIEAGPAEIGFDYSSNDDLTAINLAASMPVAAQTKAAVGVTQLSYDQISDQLVWYANVSHKLHQKVTAFAEIGNSDSADSELGWLSGIRFKF